MYQKLGSSQASNFSFAQDIPPWSSVMGPAPPLATYAPQHSQTLQSGQDAATETCTPQRDAGSGGVKKKNSQSRQERERSTLQEGFALREVMELLSEAQLDDTRIQWLLDEGFVSRRSLELLDPEEIDGLLDSKACDGPIPRVQKLALKELGLTMSQKEKGNGAPVNPHGSNTGWMSSMNPHPLAADAPRSSSDVWEPMNAGRVISGNAAGHPLEPNHRLDYQDPTVLMRMQGKHVSFHDITDYIPGF